MKLLSTLSIFIFLFPLHLLAAPSEEIASPGAVTLEKRPTVREWRLDSCDIPLKWGRAPFVKVIARKKVKARQRDFICCKVSSMFPGDLLGECICGCGESFIDHYLKPYYATGDLSILIEFCDTTSLILCELIKSSLESSQIDTALCLEERFASLDAFAADYDCDGSREVGERFRESLRILHVEICEKLSGLIDRGDLESLCEALDYISESKPGCLVVVHVLEETLTLDLEAKEGRRVDNIKEKIYYQKRLIDKLRVSL